ncbi:hypothetical protein LCGC14_2059940 [marine sediment metagenome]|uniref:Uncharacterized protein n=1 Tax=marine sediment metagenome TaxID=412755 RepID=A0A0F9ELF1_9ZZZZ
MRNGAPPPCPIEARESPHETHADDAPMPRGIGAPTSHASSCFESLAISTETLESWCRYLIVFPRG